MRLSSFIRANVRQISAEWEKFASTLLPESEFSASVLRDGIEEILAEIALDMNRSQTGEQQHGKSQGRLRDNSDVDDAAEKHAMARLKMGLSSRQLISEFRALRASVIHLWQNDSRALEAEDLYDLTRFNEAIDQALSEAATRYSDKVQHSRELFLGILAHDLRNPLAAIFASAELLPRAKSLERTQMLATQILASATRMAHMITDLSEFALVQLGEGIILHRSECSIRTICTHVMDEMKAIHQNRVFETTFQNDLPGQWDERRLAQVFSNLLGNAVQHGSINTPITLTGSVINEGTLVEIMVHNHGMPIPDNIIGTLFDSFVQSMPDDASKDQEAGSMGLGLYIANQIIIAHEGSIRVESTAATGTTFIVNVPIV